MFKQRGAFIIIAALLFISFLYYTKTLSKASEHIVSNHDSIYKNEPGEPPTSEVKGEKLKEEKQSSTFKSLCGETKWREGLWLHCHSYCGSNKTSACGGLNNARNRIQTRLRLAIDAGAGVIIASVTWRNEDNLANTNGSTSCADRFFNMEYLQESIAKECSQLNLRLCDDTSGIKHVISTRERGYAQASYTNRTFLPFIETAMEIAGFNITDISAENSAVVSYGDTLIAWDYHASSELSSIPKALFKTLKFNQALLDLGGEIYERNTVLRDGEYVGVHLRGEKDWPEEFGSAEEQMRLYKAELLNIREESSINTVYVSCGDQEAINRFRERLAPLGFNVVDKTSLLRWKENAELLATVEALDLDQKGMIEYDILVRSTIFLGIVMSTMSSPIAYARTMDDEKDFFESYIFGDSWKIGLDRHHDEVEMKSNKETRLMVVSGADVMDSFP